MIDIVDFKNEAEIEGLRQICSGLKSQLDESDNENAKLAMELETSPKLFGTHVSSSRPVFEYNGMLYIGEPFVTVK